MFAAGLLAYAHQVDKTNEANKEAVQIEANSRLEAARINAGAVNGQNGSSGNSGNYELNSSAKNVEQKVDVNAPRYEVFSCNEFRDRDGNEIVSDHEIINRGKADFYVGEPYAYVILLNNCKNKELIYFGQDAPGGQLKEKIRVRIPNDNCSFCLDGFLKKPANWDSYWTVDGVMVGENKIRVRENPGGAVSKK